MMYVLVGLPGSGKSTYAKAIEKYAVRINQDILGGRYRCQAECLKALKAGKSVIIDRCNFDESQRLHWIQYAKQFVIPVEAHWLNLPVETCLERALARTDHENLSPDNSSFVISVLNRDFVAPTLSEGFSEIRVKTDTGPMDAFIELVRQQCQG